MIVSNQYFDPNPVLVNANKLKVYHSLQGQKIVPTEAPRGLVADLKGKEGVSTDINKNEEIQDGQLENQEKKGSTDEDIEGAQISTPRSTGFGQMSTGKETLRGKGNEENSTVTCAIIVVENRLQEAKIKIKQLWVEEILKKLAYSQKKDEKIKLIGEESDRLKYSRNTQSRNMWEGAKFKNSSQASKEVIIRYAVKGGGTTAVNNVEAN